MEHKWSDHLNCYLWGEGKKRAASRKIFLLGIGGNYKETPKKIFLLGNRHYCKEWSDFILRYPVENIYKNHADRNRIFNGLVWTLHGSKKELEKKYTNIALSLESIQYEKPSNINYRILKTHFFTETIDKLSADGRLSFGYTFLYYLQALADKDWKIYSSRENHDFYISTIKSQDILIPIYILPHLLPRLFVANQNNYKST